MSTIAGPAPRPCESCPYRRDVASGVWAVSEYEKLLAYDDETWAQPMGMFQCHQADRDSEQARLCAGWVACHGQELLSLRIGVSSGRVDASVMDYTTSVPIFGSGAEAAEHGMADIENPDEEARRLITKITGRRNDLERR